MENTFGERGFVTIATGEKRYYDLAANLLHSYRYHSKALYPFAIICDAENDITEEFDAVILIDNPSFSYNDKLRLFEYMPWDETIFIDADCLAYGDLNIWWDLFSPMGDFSVFGYAYRNLNTAKRWFRPSGMKEFRDLISFVPDFNGGVYYMRKTETCKRVFSLAQHCAAHYNEYSFSGFRAPADEPVLALGMAVCGCEPLDEKETVFAPKRRDITLDISKGTAKLKSESRSVRLVHWSNYLTMKSLYRFETAKLNAIINKKSSILECLLYDHKMAFCYLWLFDIAAFLYRVKRKLKKIWKNRKK